MMSSTTAPTTFGHVFEDLLEVLWAPSSVFDRSRARAYGKYMLVLFALGMVLAFISASLTGPWMDATFDLAMQQAAAKGTPIPEAGMDMARKVAGVGVYAQPLFVVVLGGFVGGLLLMVAGKLLQAPVSYRQAVLIAVIASVTKIVGMLAGAVMALLSNAEQAKSVYQLTLGPARFLDPVTTSPLVMQLLAGLDLFNLWQLLLFGVGISVVARVARSTGFIAGLVAWVLGTALPLIPTLLSS